MAGGQYWVEPALLRAGAAGWLAGLLVWGLGRTRRGHQVSESAEAGLADR